MLRQNRSYKHQQIWFDFIIALIVCLFFEYRPGYAQEKSLDQGLNEIAQQITESIPPGTKQTVAVMDFNDLQGNVTMLGRFVSEELITRLFQTKRFKVIERSLLEKALTELKFNTTDLVDTSNAKQLGRVVGADAIVTGTITDIVNSVKINARIITVESGEIIGAASSQVAKDLSVVEMSKKVLTSSGSLKQKPSSHQDKAAVTNSNLLSLGKLYIKRPDEGGKYSYTDQGNSQLTNGRIREELFRNSTEATVGWQNMNPSIIIDLGSEMHVDRARGYFGGGGAGGITMPSEVSIFASTDNLTYSIVGRITGLSNVEQWVDIKLELTSARYISFDIVRGGEWTMIGELEVYGDGYLE